MKTAVIWVFRNRSATQTWWKFHISIQRMIIQSDDYTSLKCSNRSEKMTLAWNITAPLGCCWFGPCVTSEEHSQIRIHTALLQPQLWGQRSPLQHFLFYFTGAHIRHTNAARLMSLVKHDRPYSWWHQDLITRQMIQRQQDSQEKEIKQWIVPSSVSKRSNRKHTGSLLQFFHLPSVSHLKCNILFPDSWFQSIYFSHALYYQGFKNKAT